MDRTPPAWVDGPAAEGGEDRLRLAQERRLMRMTKALREDPHLMMQMAEIKIAIAGRDLDYARSLWHECENEEMEAIWIAPKYGGIFTTEERKLLRTPEPEEGE